MPRTMRPKTPGWGTTPENDAAYYRGMRVRNIKKQLRQTERQLAAAKYREAVYEDRRVRGLKPKPIRGAYHSTHYEQRIAKLIKMLMDA